MDERIEHPELYDCLNEYCKTVALTFKERFVRETIPQQTTWEVEDKEGGHSEYHRVSKPDYFSMVASQKDKLSDYSGYSKCVDVLLSNDLYREHLPRVTDGEGDEVEDPNHEPWIRMETIPRILTYYFETKGDLEFDEEVFKEIYVEFENYLKTDELDAQSWAVLYNFDMEPEELILEDDLRIRRISDNERGFLVKQSQAPLNPVSHHELHNNYVLEYEYSVLKDKARSTDEASEIFDGVTLGLKLFPTGGDMRYLSMISDQSSPFEDAGNRFSEGEEVTSSLRQPCELTSDECDDFVKFWNEHREQLLSPSDTIQIALRRYSDAFQRNEPEDRLIDLVIALEAMLLKPGERQELSYRMSQRGALLLSNEKDTAVKVRKQLKDAYNERSSVVHGVRNDIDRLYVKDVQELVRQCLLEFLDMAPRGNKEHSSILDDLDEIALTPN